MAETLSNEELSGILSKAIAVVHERPDPRMYASDGSVFFKDQTVRIFSPDKVNRGETTVRGIEGNILHFSYLPVGTAPGDYIVIGEYDSRA